MTCVAGLVENGVVYMAADRLGSNGFVGRTYKNDKIVRKDGILFGTTGTFKCINFLKYDFSVPKKQEGEESDAYMYRVLKEVAKGLIEDKFCTKTKDGELDLTSTLLIGYDGGLYKMQGDGSMLIPEDKFLTVGSGCYHSEASLYSTEGTELTPEQRLRKAIVCANEFVVSVNDKIQFEVLGDKNEQEESKD